MKAQVTVLLLFLQYISQAQGPTADFSYTARTDFKPDTVETKDYGDQNKSLKIVIDGWDSKVPFFIVQPSEPTNQFVILLHGLGDSKEGWITRRVSELSKNYVSLKDSLLQLGYSVIIPDAKYHGERSFEANFAPPSTLLVPSKLDMIEAMWVTTVKDLRLIMDYIELVTNENATFEVVGYSMGGMLAIMLNSSDNRLNSTVACVAPLDIPKVATNVFAWNDIDAAESLDLISPQNYASTQLSPICLLMGESDFYYTADEAKAFYNQILVDDKRIEFYESGHYLPTDFVATAINWLTTHK